MTKYRNRHSIQLKIIAMTVLCLFSVNTILWAYPDSRATANTTLSTQSIFQPLRNAGIEHIAKIEFEILAGIRLIHVGKTPSAVNGILTETYKNTGDKRKIEFLPEVTREGDHSIARFNMIGNENIIFEIKYRAARLHEVAPIATLTYGNVFQGGDEIVITKITGQASSSAREDKNNYSIRSCRELAEIMGLPRDIARLIYGEGFDKIQALELSEEACKILDDDQAVSILSRNNLVKYQDMTAFAMLKDHLVIFTTIKIALGIKEELPLPLIVLSKEHPHIIAMSHELTHALSESKKENAPTSLDEYVRNSGEREAFVNSIIVFRLIYPDKTFYDFIREQDGASKERFPDERIDNIMEQGKAIHLPLEKKVWESISRQYNIITKDNIITVKEELLKMLNEGESNRPDAIKIKDKESDTDFVRATPSDASQKADVEAKHKIARAMHVGMEGVFVYHDRLYSSSRDKKAIKSAVAGTILEIIETSYVGESEIWIKIRIKKAIEDSYYGLPGCKNSDELWVKVDSDPNQSLSLKITYHAVGSPTKIERESSPKSEKASPLKKIVSLTARVLIPFVIIASIVVGSIWISRHLSKQQSTQNTEITLKQKDRAPSVEVQSKYRIRSCGDLMKDLGLPRDIAQIIYGEGFDKIQVLEISKESRKILDEDQAVSIFSINNIVKYQDMTAFAMKKEHEALLVAVRMALGIKEDIPLPLIVLARDKPSIIALSHELTHALSGPKKEKDPRSIEDYIRDNGERPAFINSIIVFRLIYPDKTFYDFAREQDGASKERFPDERIDNIMKKGNVTHLPLEKKIWDVVSNHGNITKDNAITIKEEVLKMLSKEEPNKPDKVKVEDKKSEVEASHVRPSDESQKAEAETKLKTARAMHVGMEGVFVYHGRLYSSLGEKEAAKSAVAGTKFEIIETSGVGENEIWIKVRIKKAIEDSYYDLPGCKDGDELWVKIDSAPHKSIPIEIKNFGEKMPIDRINKSTDEKNTLKRGRSNNSRSTRFLSAENSNEKYLLSKTSRYLADYPVNIRIDLTTIPRNNLTEEQQTEQLEQNMGTLALLIAHHNKLGLDIRYILEHDTDGIYRDRALEILKLKLVELGAIPGIDANDLLGRIESPHVGKEVIELSLKSLAAIKTMQHIPDNTYYVALKDDLEKTGVPIPNYTAAATMGLSLIALFIAKKKAKEKNEYNELRGNILNVFRSIYKRYAVISEEEKFTADELELMVTGSSDTRLYYTILYALPPIVKAAIEELKKYHESLHLLLQAA
jgi:hypothetical protein